MLGAESLWEACCSSRSSSKVCGCILGRGHHEWSIMLCSAPSSQPFRPDPFLSFLCGMLAALAALRQHGSRGVSPILTGSSGPGEVRV